MAQETMSLKKFIRENFVLVVGLALPVLLMVAFMVASNIPQTLSDPPRYDFVFSTMDSSGSGNNIPVSVRLLVKNGVLTAQYTKTQTRPNGYTYNSWKKLYIYEAQTQKVRELPFGYPADMDKITGTRDEAVEALKDKKLSTTLQSPDGYELSYDGYSNSGLVNELFWGSRNNEPRLCKGSSSVRLTTGDNRTYFYYSGIEFIGWVVP